ncbi:MAG: GntR family transcriptional regulator [Peptostreptococcaceae bacterium]|nr:GntR family transcriptional regulator [Peptostreptococcaceae bacterium]
MKIIIVNGSSVPLYEQIAEAIRENILQGSIAEDEQLPSVRELSRELKVSILTVKKAYDELEAKGFIVVRQGLGSFVAPSGDVLRREEKQKELERCLIEAVRIGRSLGLGREELRDLFNFICEDQP